MPPFLCDPIIQQKRKRECEEVTEIHGKHWYSIDNLKQINQEEKSMKYVCDVCGWEYDEELGYPEGGIAPGTRWEDIPEDFECPLCSVGKDMFSGD